MKIWFPPKLSYGRYSRLFQVSYPPCRQSELDLIRVPRLHQKLRHLVTVLFILPLSAMDLWSNRIDWSKKNRRKRITCCAMQLSWINKTTKKIRLTSVALLGCHYLEIVLLLQLETISWRRALKVWTGRLTMSDRCLLCRPPLWKKITTWKWLCWTGAKLGMFRDLSQWKLHLTAVPS